MHAYKRANCFQPDVTHMHILYIAQNYQPMNASSITTHGIIRKLAERGHKITLLAPQRCPKKCILNCSLACKDYSDVLVMRVPTLVPYYLVNRYRSIRALTLAFCQLFLALKALKICSGKKIDLIVSQHHPSDLASFSAFILSRIFKLPLIIKTHDVFNSSSTVFLSLFLHTLDSMYRIIFKRANRVLVVSGPLRLKTIDIYDLEKEKVLVFPNGVDTKVFRPDVDHGSLKRVLRVEGKRIVLFIGRIREERGLTLLIKALPKIIAENSNVRVLLVGGGAHGEKAKLKKLAQKLTVEKFIEFIPRVSYSEIPKYICMSDITIGPLAATIDTFGSVPRKVLEYMACAKPVVACHGGVSSDLIIDGYNGFFVHSNRVDELASIILKLIENPDAVKEVELNARKYVEKFHDWDRIISGFEEVLCTALTKN